MEKDVKVTRLLNQIQDGEPAALHKEGLIVVAPEMRRLYARAAQVAPARISVMIVGETGVARNTWPS